MRFRFLVVALIGLRQSNLIVQIVLFVLFAQFAECEKAMPEMT